MTHLIRSERIPLKGYSMAGQNYVFLIIMDIIDGGIPKTGQFDLSGTKILNAIQTQMLFTL